METRDSQNDAGTSARSGPCAGVRVLELGTSMVSGPFCGQMLADMGAEVIKVEPPGGDIMRQVFPLKEGRSGQFLQFNRNKTSMVLDLKSEDDLALARQLIAGCDVLIENFRPGVTARLGLDYEAASAINPRMIYLSINGFGSDGPYAGVPAYDQVIQALSGFMPIQGSQDRPDAIHSVIVDKVTALAATTAVLAALLERERTSTGQHVEISMLDAFSSIILPEMLASRAFVGKPAAALPSAGIYTPMRTSDGHMLGLIAQPHQFTAMCELLDRGDLVDDERFAETGSRFARMDELVAEFEKTTITRTTAELIELFWNDGRIAIAPVRNIDEFIADPQVSHRGIVFTMDDHAMGEVRHLAPFARFGSTNMGRFSAAPLLDEQGCDIRSRLRSGGADAAWESRRE